MSAVVDNRVVEMQFDNSQFESNVQTSMNTIDSLKKSLNFDNASKGFDQINAAAKDVKLDGIAAGVDSLQQRFSNLGIVATTVIHRLTNSMIDLGIKTARFMTSGVIQGGINRAMNLENAHFQLQGLLKDEKEVQAVMKNVGDAVDGTAYSLDSAAKVASQLAASGMKAGDKMFSSLRAVAGVAAMTNSSYDDIGRIFTQVAGQGRLMGNDLLSLASRGMNAAAVLGKALNKSEAEIRDMVSKGQIDFQTFARVMDEAFGEHAKKANETFTGSMENVKAALARIGAEFVSPLIVQNGPLVKFFNTLRERVNDIKANIGPLAELFVSSVTTIANTATKYLSKLDLTNHFKSFYNIVDSLKNIFSGLLSVLKPIGKAFLDIFPTDVISNSIVDFTEKLKEFTSNLKLSDENAERLRATFRGLFSIASAVINVITSIVGTLVTLFSGKTNIADGFLSITSSIENIGAAFKDFISNVIDKIAQAGPSITKIVDSIGNAFSNAGDALSNFLNGNNVVEGGVLIVLVYWIRKAAFALHNFYKTVTSGFVGLGGVNHFLSQVTDTLFQMENKLRYDAILKIAIALAVLAGSLLLLSMIDEEDLTKGLAAVGALLLMIGGLIKGILPALGVFSKNGGGLKGLTELFGFSETIRVLSNALIKLSIALLLLSFAVKNLASVDWPGLAKGLIGVGVLLVELGVFAKVMEGNKLKSGVLGLIGLATGILILSNAVKQLAGIDADGLTRGLISIEFLLAEIAVFSNLTSESKRIIASSVALILLGSAMKIFASVVKQFGGMPLTEIGKGLLAMAGALTIVAVAMKVMPKDILVTGFALIFVGMALKSIANALTTFGGMSLTEIGRGLLAMGGALTELSVALIMMEGTVSGSFSLLLAALSLSTLATVIKTLGNLSWESIAKGLITLAASFAIIGVAGMVLGPLIPIIAGLADAIAIIGLSVLALGVGLTLAGAGLTAVAAGLAAFAGSVVVNASAIVSGLTIIIAGLIDLIPTLVKHVAKGFVMMVEEIANSSSKIYNALLKLIVGMLDALATYAPQIVDALLKFIIGIINSLGNHIPELITACMNFVGKIFDGIVQALNNIDTGSLLKGTLALAILTALMYGFAGLTSIIPSAMIGILGLGVLIAELALVLAAIGGLAQIPGLKWIIGEGGDLLQAIGTAIGQFIGGIVGGVAEGATSTLPQVAQNLTDFMTNLKPFISGVKSLDPSMLDGAMALAETILVITAADILNGITSWITGGNSLTEFANQLKPFGTAMAEFAEEVKDIDPATVESAANAGKMLSEMASTLPNSGGLAAFFAGENDLSTFIAQIVPFGKAMAEFSQEVSGVNPEAVTAAANAGKILAEMAQTIPNNGGVAGFFAGENDLATFATQLVPFGKAMGEFSQAVVNVNPEAVEAAASAGKMMTELADTIPNTGGLVSFFTGDNDLATFGVQILSFGRSIVAFSNILTQNGGINEEAVTAAVNIGILMTKLQSSIIPTGGVVQFFTGQQDLAIFGAQIASFGVGIANFSRILTENGGINEEAVTAAANAGMLMAQLQSKIVPSGGVISFFTGQQNLATFGAQLALFGVGIVSFSNTLTKNGGINEEAITAAANAGTMLASLQSKLEPMGGVISFFTGQDDLGTFGEKLVEFGKGMKSYSDSVADIAIEPINNSVKAAEGLVKLSNTLNDGSDKSIWDRLGDVVFGKDNPLVDFGKALGEYAESVSGLDVGTINTSVSAAKTLLDFIKSLSSVDMSAASKFKQALTDLGKISFDALNKGVQNGGPKFVNGINAMLNKAVASVSKASPRFKAAGSSMMNALASSIASKGGILTARFIQIVGHCNRAVIGAAPKFRTGGVMLMNNLIIGVSSKVATLRIKLSANLSQAVGAIRDKYDSFKSAGKYLGDGLVEGIAAKEDSVYNAAYKLGEKAVQGEKDGQESQSPSKATIRAGKWLGEGLVIGINAMGTKVYKAGNRLGNNTVESISSAISKIPDILNGDVDTTPTIRPVVDLSNVQSGANAINNLFGQEFAFGTIANANTINSIANRRNQNGYQEEVVSAINKLRNDLGNLEKPSYNINGITYDDGSAVSDAVKTLIQAARIERRM